LKFQKRKIIFWNDSAEMVRETQYIYIFRDSLCEVTGKRFFPDKNSNSTCRVLIGGLGCFCLGIFVQLERGPLNLIFYVVYDMRRSTVHDHRRKVSTVLPDKMVLYHWKILKHNIFFICYI
jgi:hypothetical protein